MCCDFNGGKYPKTVSCNFKSETLETPLYLWSFLNQITTRIWTIVGPSMFIKKSEGKSVPEMGFYLLMRLTALVHHSGLLSIGYC